MAHELVLISFDPGASIRDKELASSNARSHAALVCHSLRRDRFPGTLSATRRRKRPRMLGSIALERDLDGFWKAEKISCGIDDAPAETAATAILSTSRTSEAKPSNRSRISGERPGHRGGLRKKRKEKLQRPREQSARGVPGELTTSDRIYIYHSAPKEQWALTRADRRTEMTTPRDRAGFRIDPFSTYPVRFQRSIPEALDYYLHFYAPIHLLRPELFTPERGTQAIESHFRYALSDPLMFDSLVSMSRANLTIKNWQGNLTDEKTLQHYGNAVIRLRDVVSAPQSSFDDSVFFAIVALMNVDLLINDMSAFQSHLGGLRALVQLRGGLDYLGWPELLKPSIIGLENLWAFFCQQPELITSPISVPPLHTLQNPHSNPELFNYSPARELVDVLPDGYRKLAMQNRLSMSVINLLLKLGTFEMHLHQDPPAGGLKRFGQRLQPHIFSTKRGEAVRNAANLSAIEAMIRLLNEPSLTYVERMLVKGFLCLCLDMTRAEKRSPVYGRLVQLTYEEFLETPFDDADPAATNLYAWMCIEAAASIIPPRVEYLPKNFRQDIRFRLLKKVVDYFGRKMTVEAFCETMKTFVWADHCVVAMVNGWNIALM